jgi:hypothetical protein
MPERSDKKGYPGPLGWGLGVGLTTSPQKNTFNEFLKLETGWKQQRRKNVGLRNWRRKSQDREQWRAILEEVRVHQEL